MGELVRSKDWSKTPLGAIDSWPESLRTTVNLALASNFPISIAWGPGRVQIYNDGYWPICGGKHPESMGQDFKECWFSAWPAIGEMFENAAAGETGFLENQRMFLDRHGYLEETFFTFSFSPIRDETGRVVGLFHPVTEVTAQSLGERRLGVLREFSDETTNARSLEEASESIIRTLALHQLDVPFALLYLLAEDGRCARLAASTHVDLASPAAPREVALDGDSTSGWPIAEVARTCTARVVESLGARFGPLDCGPYPEPPRSAVLLPISVAGLAHPLAVLVAGVSPRRALDSAHLTFYSMLQEAVANSLVNARSYEEERKRAEALAEIDRAKTAFFSNVSHEFRTPLTLMLGPLEDALSNSSELPPSLRNQLELAHRNSLRLLKLVNSLLDFARIEANRTQVNYEATDLAALTTDLASNFRSACERAGLELRVECPALPEPIYVDRDMWEKIVLNLLSNAFKFTLAGGIGVSLRLTGDGVRLEVRDSGVGIPRHELPHMFERFYRVEGARGRTHEGTGIGLALVQELVKLHGGRIEVESELERGTTFSVSLQRGSAHLPQDRIGKAHALTPTTAGARAYVEEALRWLPDGVGDADDGAARAAPFGASADALDGSGPHAAALEPAARILLVDDNADMRDYVRRLLATRFDVATAPDGVAALELVRRMPPPDLVLSDVMMPRCDGFELLRALRADERTRAVPVILLSARAGEEARVAGLDAGADDYLVKPFSARELFARVETHVRLARIRRASEQRFRSMADAAPAILWMTDTDDRCTFLSRGWYEYTGQAEPEAMGFGWTNALHPDDREDAARSFRYVSARREPFASDYRVRHHSGEYRWVIGAGRPRFDEDGRWLGYVGSVIDITERKRAEEALKDADRRKDEFLATLAHELRNPLAPIRTGLELLRSAPEPGPEGAQHRHHGAPEPAADPSDRRPPGRQPHHAGQAAGAQVADRLAGGREQRDRGRPARHRRRAPHVDRGAAGRIRARRRRSGAAVPGVLESAEQCREVHAGGRSDPDDRAAAGRGGACRRRGQRHRHPARTAPARLRHVHADRSPAEPGLHRPRHRSRTGQVAGPDARRHRQRAQRGPEPGQRVRGAAALQARGRARKLGTGRRRSTQARRGPARPGGRRQRGCCRALEPGRG